MALRTDFRDDVFEENRKYRLIENDDGTVSLVDATAYTQEGDVFGANDINETNKAVNAHISDKNNPHGITKSQVGLGNVPNVATNDQTPTYTEATDLAVLTSGEKFSIAMGKIAKAVTDFIDHIANKSNPHGTTKAQIGLGSVDNTADADKTVKSAGTATKLATARTIRTNLGSTSTANFDGSANVTPGVTGTLPVPNGGTGGTTFPNNTVITGAGNSPFGYRTITNNTSGASASGTNIPTCNTLNNHVQFWLNRGAAVHQSNTGYTTYMARGIALLTAVPSSMTNGTVAFIYQ